MLQIFGKKKLNTERAAHHLVNALLNSVEEGFESIAEFIAYCPEFVTTPPVSKEDCGKFLMIVIVSVIDRKTRGAVYNVLNQAVELARLTKAYNKVTNHLEAKLELADES